MIYRPWHIWITEPTTSRAPRPISLELCGGGGGATKWRQTPPTANSLGGFTFNNGAAPTMLPCLQNPTTHYYANNVPAGDLGVISGNPNTWIDKGSMKSIYDPCPYGHRVPIDGSWVGFPAKTWTEGTINEGQQWQSTWWPAAGHRNSSSAALVTIASDAHYWSSSRHPSVAYYSYCLYFGYNGNVGPSGSTSRSHGLSLRCVQE